MKRAIVAMLLIASTGFAQRPARNPDFQLLRITPRYVSSPQFAYTGAVQYPVAARNQWLEVEAMFASAPEYSDELTLKYFILFNGRLLPGEVTHVNVPAARDNRSVVYVAPRTLQRFLSGRPLTNAAVQNVAVQLVQKGAVKDELSLSRAPAQWYAALSQLTGFVLNKDQTPFAPLYWERYCQIKPTH